MANRLQWDPRHGVGNESLDAQHQAILARCNALGRLPRRGPTTPRPRFDEPSRN
jgi:hypothetical protein